jgi:hypothetical protein
MQFQSTRQLLKDVEHAIQETSYAESLLDNAAPFTVQSNTRSDSMHTARLVGKITYSVSLFSMSGILNYIKIQPKQDFLKFITKKDTINLLTKILI